MRKTNDAGEPFGAWLLVRAGEPGDIGKIATTAKADRKFTPTSTADDLRARLREDGAEGDLFDVVDDAEMSWLAY